MHHFFAYMARLKLIRRWSLMRSSLPENDAEHSLQTAMLAHAIALIGRDRYGREVNPEHVLAMAVYHDATEVLTGDLPTPVKYHSGQLRQAYAQVESLAAQRLLDMLPEDMRHEYAPYLRPADDYAHRVVKAADKISAYVKCLEEQRAHNPEFDAAGENIRRALDAIDLPEVQDFLREFTPSFLLCLDEMNAESEA